MAYHCAIIADGVDAASTGLSLQVRAGDAVLVLESRGGAADFLAVQALGGAGGGGGGSTGALPRAMCTLGTPLRVLADFEAQDADEMSLREGQVVFGLRMEEDSDWWDGCALAGWAPGVMEARGFFPANFCEPAVDFPPVPHGASGVNDPVQGLDVPPLQEQGMGGIAGTRAARPSLAVGPRAGALAGLMDMARRMTVTQPPPPPPQQMGLRKGQAPPPQQMDVRMGAQGAPAPATVGSVAPAPGSLKMQPSAAALDMDNPYNQYDFKGQAQLQYALLGHNMAYGSAVLALSLGAAAVSWASVNKWNCEIDGELLPNKYIAQPDGNCDKNYCCQRLEDGASKTENIGGDTNLGGFYIFLAFAIFFLENVPYGWGNWRPTNSFCYENHFPAFGIFYFVCGLIGLGTVATCTAGFCLMCTGCVYTFATWRGEAGDGGRSQWWENRGKPKKGGSHPLDRIQFMYPQDWYRKLRDEDRLSVMSWLVIYGLVTLFMYFYIKSVWDGIIRQQEEDLLNGDIDLKDELKRKLIRYGPLGSAAAWAKGAGGSLNLHCSLLLLPVIRSLLRKLNDVSEAASVSKATEASCVATIFARPITRYIPLQKNIEFHKLVGAVVFVLGYIHTIAHFVNLSQSPDWTLSRFGKWGWEGTTLLTGAIIVLSMLFIYSGALQRVRQASYEIFFTTHHWFTVFFAMLLIHGPVFVYWSLLPLSLYIAERYSQQYRGNKAWKLVKVEWIPPVMAFYFKPEYAEDFAFKEGEYCYLNVPFISKREWHPFTISSAVDDLEQGPRVCTETGEEVVAVPRPADLHPDEKWNRFCPASKDWRTMHPDEFLEKHETSFMNYVSLHIKVFGLNDPVPRTWTRRVKDYFELLNPGDKFPFYFTTRDERGDLHVGRSTGPTGEQIIRVDGPHAAPSMHYTAYGTVMVIGAGIGMTPCASILTAMLRYRWKKNFNPEILQFYWIVRANEVDAFQWFVHLLTDLEFEVKRLREAGQIEAKNYCQINIFVTGSSKEGAVVRPLKRAPKIYSTAFTEPEFKANDLYALLKNPPVPSKHQIAAQTDPNAPNRLQDIFVWAGRPMWDEIFADARDRRVHPDIGVCFCGAPVIGRDLGNMCEKYSSVEQQVLFSLHKENF